MTWPLSLTMTMRASKVPKSTSLTINTISYQGLSSHAPPSTLLNCDISLVDNTWAKPKTEAEDEALLSTSSSSLFSSSWLLFDGSSQGSS